MTLAVVFFLGVFWAAAGPQAATAMLTQTTATTPPSSTSTSLQNQNPSSGQSSATQNSPPQSPSSQNAPVPSSGQTSVPAKAPGQTPAAAHPVRHKKKPVSSDCANGAVTPASSSATSGAASAGTAAKAASGTDSGAPPAPANCPPKKTIVPEGSTGEPSIELAGGQSGDQAAQRDTANQMLGTAEENLKKMEGRQLTASQKDLILQIRQFMEQSRSAVKAGELDRARTLAWKAQTLSEELIKPEAQ